MKPTFYLAGIAGAATLATGCAWHRAVGPDTSLARHASPVWICDHESASVGEGVLLGVLFQIEPGWHLYWNGRNDSGFAPRLRLRLPSGWTAGAWQWPGPERLEQPGGLVDHVYSGSVLLWTRVQVPDSARPRESVTIPVAGEWLACRGECVAEDAQAEVRLDIGASRPSKRWAPVFRTWQSRLPQPWPSDPGWVLQRLPEAVQFRVPGATSLEFYPAQDCAELVDLRHDGVGQGDRLRVRLVGSGAVHGILRITPSTGQETQYREVSLPAATERPMGASPSEPPDGSLPAGD